MARRIALIVFGASLAAVAGFLFVYTLTFNQ